MADHPPSEPAPDDLPPEIEPSKLAKSLHLSRQMQDIWFYVFFLLSTLAVGAILFPYRYVLLFAAVLAIVSWPMFTWLLQKTKGRRGLAAAATVSGLLVGGVLPMIWVGRMAWREGASLAVRAQELVRLAQSGALAEKGKALVLSAPDWAQRFLPVDPLAAALEAVSDAFGGVFDFAAAQVPGLVGFTADAVIDSVLFVFTLVTLYLEGPRILVFLQRLSPMDDAYDDRLFRVFWQLAQNVVVASVATAAIQGVVAAIGYAIVGVDRVVFLGIATGVGSFVPLVGTSLIWIPVAIGVGLSGGWGWAIFLAIYSLVVTTSVDNVVKPFFIRGDSQIHPLLVFLAMFGGLTLMGIPGILIGPVVVAAFLALYHIHVYHFLGYEEPTEADSEDADDGSEVVSLADAGSS